jgi:glycerol-3-phosphate dehydrogenase (NAD(P)+)
MERITILGSGAWSTACAVLLAAQPGTRVTLWGRDAAHTAEMAKTRVNARLLPGVAIPETVVITDHAEAACRGADCYVLGIPTQYLRDALRRLGSHLDPGVPVVSLVKGIENQSLLRASQLIESELPGRPVVALSGPSHAEEVARRMPSSVVVAGHELALLKRVQQLFSTDRFRVYTNTDIVGVELGGALKNVIAIAAGICDGLGYGDNAKAALMTRGIVEMTRFGVHCGALEKTFAGLAGLGDLMTTCISPHGRNRSVGYRLGKGESLAQILGSMAAVAEGVNTSRSVCDLACQMGIEMPITQQVFRVLFEGLSPREATDALMRRPVRDE